MVFVFSGRFKDELIGQIKFTKPLVHSPYHHVDLTVLLFVGGNCLRFWYHMLDHSGSLRVLQSVGEGTSHFGDHSTWKQISIQQDEWRLGYAEMYPTSYEWMAVFEATRGTLSLILSYFLILQGLDLLTQCVCLPLLHCFRTRLFSKLTQHLVFLISFLANTNDVIVEFQTPIILFSSQKYLPPHHRKGFNYISTSFISFDLISQLDDSG